MVSSKEQADPIIILEGAVLSNDPKKVATALALIAVRDVINEKLNDGNTPLILACQLSLPFAKSKSLIVAHEQDDAIKENIEKNHKIVAILLDNGADPTIVDKQNLSSLDICKTEPEILAMLMRAQLVYHIKNIMQKSVGAAILDEAIDETINYTKDEIENAAIIPAQDYISKILEQDQDNIKLFRIICDIEKITMHVNTDIDSYIKKIYDIVKKERNKEIDLINQKVTDIIENDPQKSFSQYYDAAKDSSKEGSSIKSRVEMIDLETKIAYIIEPIIEKEIAKFVERIYLSIKPSIFSKTFFTDEQKKFITWKKKNFSNSGLSYNTYDIDNHPAKPVFRFYPKDDKRVTREAIPLNNAECDFQNERSNTSTAILSPSKDLSNFKMGK